jgi:CDP-diacylglycerol--glycerol-3-phosphate 3-phosphatidyltransferase
MFSRRIQQRARHLVTLMIQPLAQLGVTPNMLTIVGLLLSILTAIVIAQGFLVAGGVLVLFAGIFDMFDGAMARVRNAATTFGAFLDSTLDRYSESIILLGVLMYALQHPGLQNTLWPAPHEQTWMIAFVFIAAVGSLMVSYTKARAEGLGIECKTGLLARPERVILLAIGLLTGTAIWALALLAAFANVTAIERIFSVWRSIQSAGVQSIDIQSIDKQSADQAKEQHTAQQLSNDQYAASSDNSDNRSISPIGTNEVKETDVRPVSTSVPPFTGGVQQE